MQLGRQCPASEPGVHPVLGEPGRVLAVGVEVMAEPAVTDDVVHRAESVIGAADCGVQEWMSAVVVTSRRPELEQALVSD